MSKSLISIFAVVALVLSVVMVSALDLSTPEDLTLANNKTTLTLSSADLVDLTVSKVDAPGVVTLLSATPASPFNGTATLNISLVSVDSTVKFGTHPITISTLATDATNSSITEPNAVSFNFIKSFCSYGAVGEQNLTINSIDMSNLGEGDDTEWRLLDTVRVEVEVENQGESDLSDIVVELAVFDSSGNEVTGDLNFINSDEEEIEIGKINDGDNEQVTFEFEVSPDFDDGDYRLAIKTYSKKSGLGQDKICDDTAGDLDNGFYQSVSVERETDEGKRIGFSNIKVNPSEATCGDAVQLTLDAINIGDEDEDQVQVTLFNKELGINQFVEIKGGLDQGDSESLSFNFEVPAGLADKTYNLELSADYDYNKGEYRQSLDDVRKISLKVLGCQPVVSTPAATITASLASEAKAGQQLTILATLKNSGTSATSFVVDASGFESWAALGSVSDRIVTLNAGESKDVTVVLNVNSGVSGDKILTVDAKSGAQTISKTVPVSIAASQGISGVSLSGNTMLWVIGAINLILVIVIIIVAIRVSRR